MGGVNVAPDYVRTMKLGFSTCVTISHRQGIERWNISVLVIRDLQKDMSLQSQNRHAKVVLLAYITLVHSWDVFLVELLEIGKSVVCYAFILSLILLQDRSPQGNDVGQYFFLLVHSFKLTYGIRLVYGSLSVQHYRLQHRTLRGKSFPMKTHFYDPMNKFISGCAALVSSMVLELGVWMPLCPFGLRKLQHTPLEAPSLRASLLWISSV